MRGPQDDERPRGMPPPDQEGSPGGKALARLVLELTSRGQLEAARQAVAAAVPDLDSSAVDELIGEMAGQEVLEVERPPDDGPEALAEVYRSVAEDLVLTPPSPTGPNWRWIGPWTIPNGQTYGNGRINVSGRVSAVAVYPRNPNYIFAAGAHGGVWFSSTRGANWTPRTDHAATLTVGALTFHPTTPTTVLAGTGEGNWWSWLGTGILRSVNLGATWTTLCTDPFVGKGFHDLEFDPSAPERVYAATTGGLYVSGDGGTTWTQRRTQRTYSLAVAPAGTEVLAACSDGLFRSTDGGTTWTAVTLPGAPTSFARLATAIAPSDTTVAYAFGASSSNAFLWRRAGGTWTSITPPTGVNVMQAWYDWFLAVAPDNAGQIYCGAISAHRGDLSGTSWTWTDIATQSTPGRSIHPDQHAIAFDPQQPQVIYIGNDGGLFRSPDRGATWQHLNNGLGITEFEYIAQDLGSSRHVLGGTQDNGTNRWDGALTWLHSQDGDGGDCAINRTDPRTVFHTFYSMGMERSTARGDWGTWVRTPMPRPQTGEISLFYPPVESSATNGDTIAQAGGALYISRNNGAAWTRLAFPVAGTASALYIPNADRVYVGTTAGRLYLTRWDATTGAWTALTALTTPRVNGYISDIHVAPGDLNRIWVTHSDLNGGRVWRSTDGGTTWADRGAGLPNLPMNTVEVHPTNPDRVWVAADLGVYQSLDGGATWANFAASLPNAFIGDLLYHPHARVLRAATRNRGVWEIPVDGWLTDPVTGVQFTATIPANTTQGWFTFGWPATWHVVWTVMPTTPSTVLTDPQLTWNVQVERTDAEHLTYYILVTNHTTQPVNFEGRAAVLSFY